MFSNQMSNEKNRNRNLTFVFVSGFSTDKLKKLGSSNYLHMAIIVANKRKPNTAG